MYKNAGGTLHQAEALTANRQLDIPKETENIDRQIAILQDVISNLSARLGKVLRSPEPNKCCDELAESPRTELSGILRNLGNSLEGERRRLDDILDRLEL